LIAAVAVGLIAGFVIALWWTTSRATSALTANLDPNWKTASAQFDSRLRRRFPVGTPIWKLSNELKSQGFKPTWFAANGEYEAMRDEGSFVCNVAARVYWRSADDRTLSTIRGAYREEGCL
jgi:hypothetical protein